MSEASMSAMSALSEMNAEFNAAAAEAYEASGLP
jgi:hypothetical protein